MCVCCFGNVSEDKTFRSNIMLVEAVVLAAPKTQAVIIHIVIAHLARIVIVALVTIVLAARTRCINRSTACTLD